MADYGVKDYTSKDVSNSNEAYRGVSSQYGRRVTMQARSQPKYCEPGEAGGGLQGAKSNVQTGPK